MGGSSESTQSPQTTESFTTEDKQYLYSLFKSEYLWYERVPDVDYTVYSSPQQMIDALKYDLQDRWSYSQTLQEYNDGANQVTQGFGMYTNENAEIFHIFIDSPADKAGFDRGDIIVSINTQPANFSSYIAAEKNLNVESIIRVNRLGSYVDVAITPSKYSYKTTKSQLLVNLKGNKIGHLIFNEFTSASASELDDVFTEFKANNIDELIVDLRYNLGGSLAVASILMDKIAGYNNENAIQMKLKFNDNYTHENTNYTFEKDTNSLNLSRVVFITSEYSASASETVINGLKPYLNVKLIGSSTHGKPVGMVGRSLNDYIYWLINFSIYNTNDEGDFYNGIEVDCSVYDRVEGSRMDINEELLKEALYYIDNGSCS
ncbi:MAG: S41 family peptidase [Campylobacterota bacterium]|nr:S41 family peptidase [Campylobacterota bacterium]